MDAEGAQQQAQWIELPMKVPHGAHADAIERFRPIIPHRLERSRGSMSPRSHCDGLQYVLGKMTRFRSHTDVAMEKRLL